ncbi:MAG: bifunctional aspartate kinase/homoserine dehydrogenase I [Acidobacteriota bacterium]
MKILKFGGSSLATAERIRSVTRIVAAARSEGPLAVVVSAFGGVTDALIAAADTASRREAHYRKAWEALRERHLTAIRELDLGHGALAERLGSMLEDLRDLLHGVYLLRETSPRTLDGILSYGERLSSEVVAASLRAAGLEGRAWDARQLIVTDDSFGNAVVDLDATYPKVRTALDRDEVAVITGFVAATPSGCTTTLGRGGSDYTAALVGAAVAAEAVELWTDVDGVMSADPRAVPDAFPLPRLSYAELMELSHFGAKVVYPPSVHPARSLGIPLVIKNTFNPAAPGTLVTETAPADELPIRGISAIHHVALMRLEGDGMVGVPGIAMRLFGALARSGVSVILISQSSSEHSICFAVSPEDAARARSAVEKELALERQAGMVDAMVVEAEQSVIAVVGEQMRQRPGLAAKVFGVLGKQEISIRAIAQGSSELNISLVIDQNDKVKALAAIHDAFFAPRERRIDVALVGVGHVGGALLEQLSEASQLDDSEAQQIRVVALANSRRLLIDGAGIDGAGIDLDQWRPDLEKAEAFDLQRLVEFLRHGTGDRVLIDCTASEALGDSFEALLASGVSVIAANKLPFVGKAEGFERLRAAARASGSALLHEATVGAGLPVLSTLEDMVRSGDRVVRIEGVLSGSVNAILESLADGEAFSRAVAEARRQGLTEPHPWQDLSGGDVARKLCILSRLSGRPVEMEDIHVEPVIAGDWSELEPEAFLRELERIDADLQQQSDTAKAGGKRLRYLAALDEHGARVALTAVPADHPAYHLAGADNLVAFTTERYRTAPLVLRGPGAGPAVTAAGVFANLLRFVDRRRYKN